MIKHRFMVGTHSNLIDCSFDTNWNLLESRSVGAGYHYGLSSHNHDLTVKGNVLTAMYGGPDVHNQSSNKLCEYRCEGARYELFNSRSIGENCGAIHQIICTEKGVYFVNTAYNSIVFQSHCSARSEFFIDGRNTDVNHVNSIIRVNDFIVVLLHNKLVKESELLVLTHDNKMEVVSRHSLWDAQCHNIYFDTKYLYYNASSARSFVKVDWRLGNIVDKIETIQHTKGLSVVDDYFIIGGSDYAERSRRSKSSGNLLVIDRKTFSLVKEIPLKIFGNQKSEEIGNINEIRALMGAERGEYAEVSDFPRDVNLATTSPHLIAKRLYWNARRYRRILKSN